MLWNYVHKWLRRVVVELKTVLTTNSSECRRACKGRAEDSMYPVTFLTARIQFWTQHETHKEKPGKISLSESREMCKWKKKKYPPPVKSQVKQQPNALWSYFPFGHVRLALAEQFCCSLTSGSLCANLQGLQSVGLHTTGHGSRAGSQLVS